MKQIIISTCLLALGGHFVHAQDGSVKVTVESIIKEDGGDLIISLYNNEDGYPKPDGSLRAQVLKVVASSMSYTFSGLPEGNYAIVAFQDADQSKSLRKSFIGMPKEPIGFSQNNKIRFGAPSYEESRFEVAEGKLSDIKIELIQY